MIAEMITISDFSDKHLIIIFTTYLLLDEYTFKKIKKKKKTNSLAGIESTEYIVRNAHQKYGCQK